MKRSATTWLSAALACPYLSSTQKIVGAAIACTIETGPGQIGYRQLGEACACSHRSAMRAVCALEGRGWLTVGRVAGEANVFALLLPMQVGKAVR